MDIEQLSLLTAGLGIGVSLLWLFHRVRVGSYKNLATEILQRAEMEAEIIRKNAEIASKQQQVETQQKMDAVLQKERKKLHAEELHLKEKEDKLERRMNLVEKKLSDSEKREAILIVRREQLEEEKKKVQQNRDSLFADLEKLAGISSAEAKEILLSKIKNEIKTDATNLVRRAQKEAEEESEKIASTIIATAINRLAVPCVSEVTVTTVPLPNDEMKGRIIGREGRNIRTLERATGISFLIDDTPGMVVLSGFDPIRKQIAKLALTELIQDGRIHPTRIDEVVAKSRDLVDKQIRQDGEDAAFRAGAMDLHPDLIMLLGKLKLRYSYGQNVLEHSLEVSHLMGIMAAELGADIAMAKRIGLLHDMGKALSHEVKETHAVIGHDLALKCGESKEVANGIGCHHGEMEPMTIEAWLCCAADKISASRPGARIEAVEEYTMRLKKLESLAYEFPGVEKAYAMQAGREVRIAVLPEVIDDEGIVTMARDLTKRIEKELRYPGKIKITIIREKRAIEYAI